MDIVTKLAGLYYEIDGKTIFIKRFITKYYDIGIPKVVVDPTIEMSGNVLKTEGDTVGSGNIELKYDLLKNDNPYKRLDEIIRKVMSNNGKYIIDEDSGLLIVTDTIEAIKRIDKIIEKFKAFYSKQVEVEVNIIEVAYSNMQKQYIDWGLFFKKIKFLDNISFEPASIASGSGLVIKGGGENKYIKLTTALFNFLKQYGRTEMISSPKLRLTNGYTALVVAGVIKPFFKKNEQFITGGNTNTTETQKVTKWEQKDYLQGSMLAVKVRVDESNQIYLQVTPMISDIISEVSSPDGSITAPITVTRQASTILKLKDGDIAIIGGLKGKKLHKNLDKIPGAGDIRYVGELFKGKSFSLETTELVMLIRAKLVY